MRDDQLARTADHYQAEGFARVPDIVDVAVLDQIAERYDAILASWNAETTSSGQVVTCPALTWMRPTDAVGAELIPPALATPVTVIARKLLDASAVDVSARIFVKPPGGRGTVCHQDAAYSPRNPRERLNMWIPLEDATIESGCLYYHPRSHAEGLQLHRVDPSDPSGSTLTIAVRPDAEAVAAPVPAGELVLHHRFMAHGSYPNVTASPRRGLVLVCEAAG